MMNTGNLLNERIVKQPQIFEMTDPELRTAFENCTLPRTLWNHRAHLRMAYPYAAMHHFTVALERTRQSIQEYNKSQQISEALDRGYHETITVAFMRLVCNELGRSGPFTDSDAFCDCHPELLDKSLLLRFYSKDRLMSEEAKRTFVESDLDELSAKFAETGQDIKKPLATG